MSPAFEKGAQTRVVLRASRAALEVSAQARQELIRRLTGQLELYIAVELVETLIAAELGAGRTKETLQQRASPRRSAHLRVAPSRISSTA